MKTLLTATLIGLSMVLFTSKTHAQCYSAVQLDGVDDYLHSPFSNYTFNQFTLEMWLNPSDINANEHYISLYQNAYIVLGGWGSGGIFDTWADGLSPIALSSPTAPSMNSWHHVAFVFDGQHQILYVDGIPVSTIATTGSVNSPNASFNSGLVIGARYDQNQQHTNSAFSDVRIWNVARTQTEITNHMNSNLNGNETGLVAYYRFEDGQGSSTVTDLTGNGNTLTLYNMDPNTVWFAPTGPPSSAVYHTQVETACESFTWLDGNTYTSNNNTATFTFAGGAANGCDSIVTLDLTVNSSSTGIDTQTACQSFTWIDGNTYTSSNNSATYTIIGGAANGCDSIVTLDLTVNSPSTGIDTQTACQSFTWVDGNTYTSSNNSATYTINGGAANGCDSIVTLNLTLNTVDVTVINNDPILSASHPNATYQWIDCDNGDAIIPNETNQTFTATQNGDYAVIVSDNGCADTSTCVTISTVGLEEFNDNFRLVIYPNPSSHTFYTEYNGLDEPEYYITDIAGRIVLSGSLIHGTNNFDLLKEPAGIYFMYVNNGTFKLVKE